MNTPERHALRAFPQHGYTLFGCRRDALCEALDAVLSAPSLETPAHLSRAPHCPRGWGRLYDALNAETMDLARRERLVASCPLAPQTTWLALDASVWPRFDAETSPDRGFSHHLYRQSPGQPMVAGWNSSWLAQVPRRCARWTAPLRVRRLIPGEHPTLVAAEHVRSWREQAGPLVSVPIFSFAAGDDAVPLRRAVAPLPVGFLVRRRAGRRCFDADPTTHRAPGRPRRPGAKVVCDDPAPRPVPTDRWTASDPQYGSICVQAWSGLHATPQNHATRGTRQPRPLVRGTLIRREVARLPRPTNMPTPLWFWWSGPTPPAVAEVWQASTARFSLEHTCRFFKQTLRWTTPKLRSPRAADR
jgi:hypothetical protein